MTDAIAIDNLTIYYQSNPILWEISTAIPSGKIVAIVGPNGAGKSTLLKSLIGILEPFSGSITIFGKKFLSIREKVAYVPQRESIDWDFPITVKEVVLMGRYHKLGLFRWVRASDERAADEFMELLDIAHLKDRQIGELSGGQQQRVFIARALIQDADLYLLDEPFTGVDIATENLMIDLFKKLQQKGKTLVIVHHDLESLEKIFDWVILLNNRLIAQGDLASTYTLENISKTFGKKEEIFSEVASLLHKKKKGVK